MSIGNPGVQPGGAGGATPVPGGQQPQRPKNTVAQEDTDAFDSALGADSTGIAAEEVALTPEEQLIDLMKKDAVKQFMTTSQEHTQEVKKNMEG